MKESSRSERSLGKEKREEGKEREIGNVLKQKEALVLQP